MPDRPLYRLERTVMTSSASAAVHMTMTLPKHDDVLTPWRHALPHTRAHMHVQGTTEMLAMCGQTVEAHTKL